MNISLNPYSIFIDLKNCLYDEKYFEQFQTDIKIISIGNLNTGGSGKTPLIQFLVSMLRDQKILIVCRSYKANLKKPAQVNLDNLDVKTFGDEACLLKQLLPGCDIWSGPSKSETVKAALASNPNYKFIIVDDGFSHRKLFRHRDIVLIDLSRSKNHYRLFPFGFMREGWDSLKRSHLVILTKAEDASLEHKTYFVNKVLPFQKNIIYAKYQTELDSINKKLFLITGIGNPEKLKSDLERAGFSVEKFQFYPDHYEFSEAEQSKILKLIESNSNLQPVVTAKDYIKITNQDLLLKLKVAHLKISMTTDDRKIFDEKIIS